MARANFPTDYVAVGSASLLPLRWLPPEFIARLQQQSDDPDLESGGRQIQSSNSLFKNIPQESNLWSLGITLWEIAAFGNLPFQRIYNSQFLSSVSELSILMSRGPGPVSISVSNP